MKQPTKILTFTLSLLLSFTYLSASEKSANAILSKAFEHTSSLKSYAFEANISEEEAQEDGTFVTYKYHTAVKVLRPNKIRMDSKGKYLDRSSAINDGIYTVVRHNDKTYSQLKTPKNIDDAIVAILHKYNVKKAPLAAFVYSDPSKHIKATSGHYLGEERLEAGLCDHLSFKSKNRDIDVWVTQEKTPHIVAYQIKDTHTQPFVYTKATITWNKQTKVTPNDFVLTIPKESQKIEIVTEDSES